jgi:hypothetical protein
MEWKDFSSIAMFVFVVAGGLITAGGLIYSLRGVISEVQQIQETLEHQKEALHNHVSNKEEHVNRLHMASLKEAIDANSRQYDRINEKLDRIVEKIYSGK